MRIKIYLLLTLLIMSTQIFAQKNKNKEAEKKEEGLSAATLSNLKFRSLGPALTSGRISDFAVNPQNPSEYFVASSAGGVWKTTNGGVTFSPVFDQAGAFSIGTVVIDPNNPYIVWVGSGENNNQRSVNYGDGVYKSEDGGKTWKNMGLKNSEHISKIIVDPRNSDVVYVAAVGPLWSAGGDRGVYKTTDGGKTWKAVFTVSTHTGIADMAMDPSDPDILYAAAHQRRRHVFTYISGGPESAIYKTTDGGATWNKLTSGVPSAEKGRIGLAVSPVNPNIVYAIIEASDSKDAGFYRSLNKGASFEKRSGHSTSGNYYQEIMADPVVEDRVYSMDTWGKVSNDGGKTWQRIGNDGRHVDDHAIWIDPNNPDHLLNGNDGGVYETWDRGNTWHFKANLPVTQFYKVSADNAAPFYNIYGGTQDNFTIGGPSRTTSASGITNSDWFITNGGDGFETVVDPENPDIIYSQSQYGYLVRFDKKSGEAIGIKPLEGKDEPALRWNWDAPLIISPHSHTRLYFAANKLYKSDNRGDSWTAISGDLTRQIDRDKLAVMDKVWHVDAVAKNASTSNYGNVVALAESPVKQGLIYVGTDDGLIQVTEDDGKNWRKIDKFSSVPDMTYVNSIIASNHNADVVYAAFNNHKNGDFKPYILKSTDKGKTWSSIGNNLPSRGSVYSLAEDHKDPQLLFAGTEFGIFYSNNGGQKWIQLKGGLPSAVLVRDIEIQRRENDLVLATFGRGFYILDDYSPLRTINNQLLEKDAHIFPVKDALVYVEAMPLGLPGKSFQGSSYFTAENPPFGAIFTYYLEEPLKSLKERRKEKEKEAEEKNEIIGYPSYEVLKAEDDEEKSYLIFTISDESGNVVRRLTAPGTEGIQRIAWDLRYPAATPIELSKDGLWNPWAEQPTGPLVVPGDYLVSLSKNVNGNITELVPAQKFAVKSLNANPMAAKDVKAAQAFQREVNRIYGEATAINSYSAELNKKIDYLKEAVKQTPDAPLSMLSDIKKIEADLNKIAIALSGDPTLSRRNTDTPPSILGRLGYVTYNLFNNTFEPTLSQRQDINIAKEQLEEVKKQIVSVNQSIKEIEKKLEKAGAPWTPGRLPENN